MELFEDLKKIWKDYKKELRLVVLVSLLPVAIILKTVLEGSIPFWYDPARDMIRARENITDLTLLGPTTGVEGVFYGPYWIWALSLAILINPDPRLAIILVQVLPYFLFFPVALFSLRKFFPSKMWLGLWLYFGLALSNYIAQPWNPHIAPLLILATAALLLADKKPKIVSAGIVAGLTINFHFAMGIVVFIASGLYLLLHQLKVSLKSLRQAITFGLAGLLAFGPTMVFEVRNNFLQTRSLLNMFFASYTGGEVDLDRLPKPIVVKMFFETLASFFKVPLVVAMIIFGLICISLIKVYRQEKLKKQEKQLLLWVGIVFLVMCGFYLGGKTPVWMYHYIGIQVLILLLVGWLAKWMTIWKVIVWSWVGWVVVVSLFSFTTSIWKTEAEALDGLAGKEAVVEYVYQNAGEDIAYAAYSPAIFTYDYDYLFEWKSGVYTKPIAKDGHTEEVYVILPPGTSESKEKEFVSYKSPDEDYETAERWEAPSGAVVYKRVRGAK